MPTSRPNTNTHFRTFQTSPLRTPAIRFRRSPADFPGDHEWISYTASVVKTPGAAALWPVAKHVITPTVSAAIDTHLARNPNQPSYIELNVCLWRSRMSTLSLALDADRFRLFLGQLRPTHHNITHDGIAQELPFAITGLNRQEFAGSRPMARIQSCRLPTTASTPVPIQPPHPHRSADH